MAKPFKNSFLWNQKPMTFLAVGQNMAKPFKNSFLWNPKPMTFLFSRFYIGGPFAVKLVFVHICLA